ncbi:MAG: hypothetical protein FJX29_04940 [Alphaproteobacteria bacterium]|nr:hypothetical protein [Alphaproteobacteria bacterium]
MAEASLLFQLPNLLIAMAMYSILARFLLSLFMSPDQVMLRVFIQITEPVLAPVRAITPRIVPDPVIFIFAFIWLFALRIGFYIIMRMYDLIPSIAG